MLEQLTTELRGTVADPDHDESELVTTWRVNGDTVCEDVVPDDDGTTSCSTTLTTGAVTVALSNLASSEQSISFSGADAVNSQDRRASDADCDELAQ